MRDDAAALTRRFLANWTRFLAIHLAVSVLVFTILTPAATGLLRLAVSLSGSAALSDQDILFFVLSPYGFICALVLGSIFSIIIFLGHAALLVVAASTNAGEAASVKQVLLFLVGRMSSLFQLALLILLRVLLNLLPFVLLLLLVFQLLLSDYDINYYLAEKPAEWRWAIALGSVIGLACGANLLRLFINWIFCLPLSMFSERSPRQALADSKRAARGHRGAIGAWLLAWLIASLLLTATVSALLTLAGMYLIPHAAGSIKALLLALGLVSLTGFVLYFAVTFAASAWLSLLIMKLFVDRGLRADVRPSAIGDSTQRYPLLADRRVLGWGLLAGFVAALGVRLREIRQRAGLSLVEVAHMMGQEPSYRAHLSQLERGQVPSPSLVLVADYLRACRASFADLLPVLSIYTDKPPVREPRVRELVAAELKPLGGQEAARLMVYDRKVGDSQKPEARVRAARKQARAAGERRLLDDLMGTEVNRLGVEPTFVMRKVALDYARMVWKALRQAESKPGKKRGRPSKTREQRLADARVRFRELAPGVLPDRALEQVEAKVAALYEDVHRFGKPGQ